MLSTNELFDLCKAKHRLESDYSLAKRLKITAASISLHRKKPHGMDSALALRVAECVGYLPEYVLICAACERSKCDPEREAWQRLGAWVELRYKDLESGYRLAAQNRAGYRL